MIVWTMKHHRWILVVVSIGNGGFHNFGFKISDHTLQRLGNILENVFCNVVRAELKAVS